MICVSVLSQVALAGTQIWWTTEVNISFARLEEGYENALKDYYKKQVWIEVLIFYSLACNTHSPTVEHIHTFICTAIDACTHTHTHIQVSQLNTLITHLLGDLTKGDRQKIMTICTIDVHARDVVQKMITQKVENAQAFLWLSQLRHR